MNILEEIVQHKRQEVAERKSLYPVKLLEQSLYFRTPVVSMKAYLLRPDKSGIIAEFKRQSPSKGPINPYALVEQVTIGYMQAGASGLSILTDSRYFGGTNEDLTEARTFNFCPILRKDFVIDEYQIIEARSIGADVVLLIAECLDRGRLKELARFAKDLGMEVLMEIHSEEQLEKANEYVDIIGVNNRDLKTFTVDLQTSLDLYEKIPRDFVPISESGISDPNAIIQLKDRGFRGFLIGEYFMQEDAPHKRCQAFIRQIRSMEDNLKNAIA